MEKIAKFIGKEISPETCDLIVQQTSFGAMKSSEHTNFSWFEGMKGDGKSTSLRNRTSYLIKCPKKEWKGQGLNLNKLTVIVIFFVFLAWVNS